MDKHNSQKNEKLEEEHELQPHLEYPLWWP